MASPLADDATAPIASRPAWRPIRPGQTVQRAVVSRETRETALCALAPAPDGSDAKLATSRRDGVVAAFPRTACFKEDIIQAFYDGIRDRPETVFGNVKADVLADKDPGFRREDFCGVIQRSPWPA